MVMCSAPLVSLLTALPPPDIPVSLRCDGLGSLGSQPSAAACLNAACASALDLYQWCGASGCDSGVAFDCWAGSYSDCSTQGNSTGTGWVSAATSSVIPPGPAPLPPPTCPGDRACVAFDDSSWRTVQVPHDYVVEGSPVPTADRNHGYLPFNYSWCARGRVWEWVRGCEGRRSHLTLRSLDAASQVP